jgi:hypothetical protein
VSLPKENTCTEKKYDGNDNQEAFTIVRAFEVKKEISRTVMNNKQLAIKMKSLSRNFS